MALKTAKSLFTLGGSTLILASLIACSAETGGSSAKTDQTSTPTEGNAQQDDENSSEDVDQNQSATYKKENKGGVSVVSFNKATIMNMNGVKTGEASSNAKTSGASKQAMVSTSSEKPINISITDEGSVEYTAQVNGDEVVFIDSKTASEMAEEFNYFSVFSEPHSVQVNGAKQPSSIYLKGSSTPSGDYDTGGYYGVYNKDDDTLAGFAISMYNEKLQKNNFLQRRGPDFPFTSDLWHWENVRFGYMVVLDDKIVEQAHNESGAVYFSADSGWSANFDNINLSGDIEGIKVSGEASYNDGQIVGYFEGIDAATKWDRIDLDDYEYVATGGAFAGGEQAGDDFFVGAWSGLELSPEIEEAILAGVYYPEYDEEFSEEFIRENDEDFWDNCDPEQGSVMGTTQC